MIANSSVQKSNAIFHFQGADIYTSQTNSFSRPGAGEGGDEGRGDVRISMSRMQICFVGDGGVLR